MRFLALFATRYITAVAGALTLLSLALAKPLTGAACGAFAAGWFKFLAGRVQRGRWPR